MNKLIIIGNGFDLAHGIKTSYNHFIDNYFNNAYNSFIEKNNYSDDLLAIQFAPYRHSVFQKIKEHVAAHKLINFFSTNSDKVKLIFKGDFFKSICQSITETGWAYCPCFLQ